MAKRKPPPTLLEMKAMDWRKYMKTRHWINYSKSLLDKHDCVCEICNRPRWGFYKVGIHKGKKKKKPLRRYNVHHKRYNLGEETEDDVLVLCQICHSHIHELYNMKGLHPIYEFMYQYIVVNTKWEYTPFKKRELNLK